MLFNFLKKRDSIEQVFEYFDSGNDVVFLNKIDKYIFEEPEDSIKDSYVLHKGISLIRSGNIEKGIITLSALAKGYNDYEREKWLGFGNSDIGNYTEANKYLLLCLENTSMGSSHKAEVLSFILRNCIEEKDFNVAKKYIEEYSSIIPEHPIGGDADTFFSDCLGDMMYIYSELGNIDKAISCAENAMRIEPNERVKTDIKNRIIKLKNKL